MKKPFTLNDLILYAYGEVDKQRKVDYKKNINNDNIVRSQFGSILKAKYYVESTHVKPGKNVISNLLSYSKALSVMPTTKSGNIAMVLN